MLEEFRKNSDMNAEGLVPVVERALAMDAGEVQQMRQVVRDCFGWFLNPKSFPELVIRANTGKILVNAEEKSVF